MYFSERDARVVRGWGVGGVETATNGRLSGSGKFNILNTQFWFCALVKFEASELNKSAFNKWLRFFFFQILLSVRRDKCNYSPQAPSSLATSLYFLHTCTYVKNAYTLQYVGLKILRTLGRNRPTFYPVVFKGPTRQCRTRPSAIRVSKSHLSRNATTF